MWANTGRAVPADREFIRCMEWALFSHLAFAIAVGTALILNSDVLG